LIHGPHVQFYELIETLLCRIESLHPMSGSSPPPAGA
jgi:hypothetical protein